MAELTGDIFECVARLIRIEDTDVKCAIDPDSNVLSRESRDAYLGDYPDDLL
jgi:hypothetical protein